MPKSFHRNKPRKHKRREKSRLERDMSSSSDSEEDYSGSSEDEKSKHTRISPFISFYGSTDSHGSSEKETEQSIENIENSDSRIEDDSKNPLVENKNDIVEGGNDIDISCPEKDNRLIDVDSDDEDVLQICIDNDMNEEDLAL